MENPRGGRYRSTRAAFHPTVHPEFPQAFLNNLDHPGLFGGDTLAIAMQLSARHPGNQPIARSKPRARQESHERIDDHQGERNGRSMTNELISMSICVSTVTVSPTLLMMTLITSLLLSDTCTR